MERDVAYPSGEFEGRLGFPEQGKRLLLRSGGEREEGQVLLTPAVFYRLGQQVLEIQFFALRRCLTAS